MIGNNAQIYENMRLYAQIVRKLVETGRLPSYINCKTEKEVVFCCLCCLKNKNDNKNNKKTTARLILALKSTLTYSSTSQPLKCISLCAFSGGKVK